MSTKTKSATAATETKINMLVGNHIKGNYDAWSEKRYSKDDLNTLFNKHQIPDKKDSLAFCLATFTKEGGKTGSKKIAHIKAVTGAAFDFDAGHISYDAINAKCKASGYEYRIYTSYGNMIEKNDEPAVEKFRCVFPFASTWHIGGDNKKAGFYRHKAYIMLAKHLGFEIEDLDETAGDVNRGHYYPACPEDKKEIAKCDSGEGKRLDPNILAIQTGIVSKYYVDGIDINL